MYFVINKNVLPITKVERMSINQNDCKRIYQNFEEFIKT